jgi:hypothetical protein
VLNNKLTTSKHWALPAMTFDIVNQSLHNYVSYTLKPHARNAAAETFDLPQFRMKRENSSGGEAAKGPPTNHASPLLATYEAQMAF